MSSTINFPTTLSVALFSWAQQRRDIMFASSFGSQAVENSPPLWSVSLKGTPEFDGSAGAWQALLLSLRGRTNRLALWNIARPVPLGTLRGTLTLSGAHAQGATSLVVTGGAGQAGATVKQGDMFGVGTGTAQQVVMAVAAATADGAGLVTIQVEPSLRNAFLTAEPITWNMPCALFRMSTSKPGWDMSPGGIMSGVALDLIEDWR